MLGHVVDFSYTCNTLIINTESASKAPSKKWQYDNPTIKIEQTQKHFAMGKEINHVSDALDVNNVNDENGLTVEKAREILGDKEISDEKLQEIVNAVKIFCKLSYELYSVQQRELSTLDENRVIPLGEEDDLQEAA